MLLKYLKSKTFEISTKEAALGFDYSTQDKHHYEYNCNIKFDSFGGSIHDLIDLIGEDSILAKAYEQLPDVIKEILEAVELNSKSVKIADFASLSYESVNFAYQKLGVDHHNWLFELEGEFKLTNLVTCRGWLQINMGNSGKPDLEFVVRADSGQIEPIDLPLPLAGQDLRVKPTLQRFTIQASGGYAIKGTGRVELSGGPDFLQPVLPESAKLEFKFENGTASIVIRELMDNKKISLPNLPALEGGSIPLGELVLSLEKLSLNLSGDSGIAVELGFGLPPEFNNIFPSLGWKNAPPIFHTYDPNQPKKTMLRCQVAGNQESLTFELLSSPLRVVSTVIKKGKLWWIVDLGEYGEVHLLSPKFLKSANSSAMAASGGFDIVRPLRLPLWLIKKLLGLVSLDSIADELPDSVELEEIDLLNEQGQLSLQQLSDVDLPEFIVNTVNSIGKHTEKLPNRLQSFFKITIPQKLLYDFEIDAKGGVKGSITLENNDSLRFLRLGGTSLVGVDLRKLSVGNIPSISCATVEVDATIDQFNLLEMAASLALAASPVGSKLPPLKDLYTTIEMNKLFILVSYHTGIPIPIPLFYDHLGLDRLGVEGSKIGSHFEFPNPIPNARELTEFALEMTGFLTNPKTLLDEDNPPGKDITFTIGANYLTLPEYLGGSSLGSQEEIITLSAWKYIAHSLNFLKTAQIDELLASVPVKHCHGSQSINLFSLADIKVQWLITSPQKLKQSDSKQAAVKHLQLKSLPAKQIAELLPKNTATDNIFLVLLAGSFTVAKTLKFQSLFGLSGHQDGLATCFKFNGKVTELFDLDVSGQLSLVTTPTASLQVTGQTYLMLAKQTVMNGQVGLKNDQLWISGEINLFPNSKLVSVSSLIAGKISSEEIKLNGKTDVIINDKTAVSGKLSLTHEKLCINGKFLGQTISLQLEKRGRSVSLQGTATCSCDYKISTPAIAIKGFKIMDTMSYLLDLDLTLNLELTVKKFTLKVEASFTFQGQSFNVDKEITQSVPKNLTGAVAQLKDQLISEVEKYFKSRYVDPEKWINDIANKTISLPGSTYTHAVEILKYLKSGGIKGATELGNILWSNYSKNDIAKALMSSQCSVKSIAEFFKGKRVPAKDVADALKSAGASAKSIAKIIFSEVFKLKSSMKTAQILYDVGFKQAKEVAGALKYAGGEAKYIAKALFSDVFKLDSSMKTAQILYDVGFKQAKEVAGALKYAGGEAKYIAKALFSDVFKLDSSIKTAQILYDVGFKQAKEVAGALKYAGSEAKYAAKALEKVGFNATKNILQAAGYPAGELEGLFKSVSDTLSDYI